MAIDPTAANTGLLTPSFLVLLFWTRMPLTIYRLMPHGADRLNMAPLLPLRQPRCSLGLAIGTLNIWDGRSFGLVQAIQAVERGGFGVMILTETKIQSVAYSYNCLGYDVNCLTTCASSSGGSQGSFRLVMRERNVGWGIESIHYNEPNVVSCKIVTGLTRTTLVGA